MPPTTAVLLNSVQPQTAGVASGVFNTSRQIGGALAIAVFGALLANRTTFMHGVRLIIGMTDSTVSQLEAVDLAESGRPVGHAAANAERQVTSTRRTREGSNL